MRRAELVPGERRRAGGSSGPWGLAGGHKTLIRDRFCSEGLAP